MRRSCVAPGDDGYRWRGGCSSHPDFRPGRYVAASQIGITVSSLVLGAYAQATVAVSLALALAASGH